MLHSARATLLVHSATPSQRSPRDQALGTFGQEDLDGPFMISLLPSCVTGVRVISQLDLVGDSQWLFFWERFLKGGVFRGDGVFQNSSWVMVVSL